MSATHAAPASSDLVISRLLRPPPTCVIGGPLQAPMVDALFDRHARCSSVTMTCRERVRSRCHEAEAASDIAPLRRIDRSRRVEGLG
jgi:hypothetical protein